MNQIAQTIIAPANLARDYAKMMLKDVTPHTFARLAQGAAGPVQSNHPAWVYGHLSLYNRRVLEMLGQPEGPAAHPEGFEGLFKNGTPCLDDPNGTIYPAMDKVVGFYYAGLDAAMAAIKNASDAQLMEPNPAEGRMKDLFPTKGGVCNFILSAHPMMHFGQVSAWRRMMGLGSAM